MATNKKKEAAALFELIDKSTLKVPKHAGALKIPDWWSSKTNPATAAPVAAAPAAVVPPKGAEGEAPAAKEAVKQPRLFEPPADGTHPISSPSIRPPAPAPPSAAVSPPRAAVAPPPAAPVMTPAVVEEPEEAPAPVKRPFLPQTMEQGGTNRPQWGGQQRRRMARTPKWAILAGALGVVIVISLMAFVLLSGRRHAAEKANEVTTPTVPTVQQGPAEGGGSLLPMPAGRSAVAGNGGSPGGMVPILPPVAPPAQPPEEAPTAPGKVYGPGTVQRSPELYYIRITTTPTLSVAQKSADFLASKGVDVSVEVVASNGKTHLYRLYSVKGFATVVEAEPFRKEIVRIGHEYKKYPKVWDDAYSTHVMNVGK